MEKELFKVGDRLKADDYHREEFGISYVTITSINKDNRVYHWTSKTPLYDKMVINSGYPFSYAERFEP